MDEWMNRWEDRWANKYNTLDCSEVICPKWSIVVDNKLETKNDDEKISTVVHYWVHTPKTMI